LLAANHPDADVTWSQEYFDSTDRGNWTPADRQIIKELNMTGAVELRNAANAYHGI
jgi:hypothetical protein